MTNMQLFQMTARWNQALLQFNIDHPMHGRAQENYQLVVRLGGILPRIDLYRHSEPVDTRLEADAKALDEDIAKFTQGISE